MTNLEQHALASVGRRAAALFVDVVFLYIVILLVANLTDSTQGYSPFGFKFGLAGDLLIAAGGLVYFTVLEAEFGMTLGKGAAGIKVMATTGAKPGWTRSAIRNVARLVDTLPYFPPYLVGAIAAWNSGETQRLGDRLARTVVIERHQIRMFTPPGTPGGVTSLDEPEEGRDDATAEAR
jgi:uncharacterized RDD family membrane protein YckC